MHIDYRNNETRKICEIRKYALRLYPEKVVDRLNRLLYKLQAEDSFSVFQSKKTNQTYRIHELQGKKRGADFFEP